VANKVKGLIEFVGVAEDFPINPTNFKQLSVQETLCIPSVKPDCEQIVTVSADIAIIKTKVVKTPGSAGAPAISNEGQRLYGYKLVIEGYLCQTIEYVADEPTQSVHAAHFKVPFSTYIVLPPNFTPDTPLPTVTGYIEDIFVEQIDKRCIFKNVTILLVAQF
jgi:hypothetical protein